MNKAQAMFSELGFKLCTFSETLLLYQYKSDYEEMIVHFNLEKKSYYTTWSRFVDNNERTFVPMDERPQNTKHSAYYGPWQAEMWHETDIAQHNAIHQQIIELGWIK